MDQEYNVLFFTSISVGVSLLCVISIAIMHSLNCIKNERYYTILRNGIVIRQRTESSEI